MTVSLRLWCSRSALLLAVLLVGYSAVTPLPLPGVDSVSDKLLHALSFAVLLMLSDFSWPETGLDPVKWGGVFAYGVLIECVQYFLPYRDFSLADMLADAIGMAVYALSVPVLRHLPLLSRRWYR